MSKRLGIEEVEITRSEKFLSVVLAAFLLVGGLWVYSEPLDRTTQYVGLEFSYLVDDGEQFGSIHDRRALKAHRNAKHRVDSLEGAVEKRQNELELKRESYRTLLDAGKPADEQEKAYQQAQVRLDKTNQKLNIAKGKSSSTSPAAKIAERNIAKERRNAEKEAEKKAQNRELLTFFLRLAFVLITLGAAFLLFNRMRRSQSRYITVAWAGVGYSTALALVMASDYTTDYINIGKVGPLVLSLVGVTFTLLAIIALHRFLAKRTPHRRVRRHQCPFCGYPVSDSTHCEGCGRKVLADCSNCGNERRVGSQHCRSCGKA